jgi:hypothetical protein
MSTFSGVCKWRNCNRCDDEKQFSREFREAVHQVSSDLRPGEASKASVTIISNQRFVRDLVSIFENAIKEQPPEQVKRLPEQHQGTIDAQTFYIMLDTMGYLQPILTPREVGSLFMFNSTKSRMKPQQWVDAVGEVLSMSNPNMDPCLGAKLQLNPGCCDMAVGRLPKDQNPEYSMGMPGYDVEDPSGECRYPGF